MFGSSWDEMFIDFWFVYIVCLVCFVLFFFFCTNTICDILPLI